MFSTLSRHASVTVVFVVTLMALVACSSAVAGGLELFVSPTGSDTNPGSLDKPFATPEKARDTIRALKGRGGGPAGGVTVQLRGGTYYLKSPFALGPEDSGTGASPVIYRNYGAEEVRLSGGAAVSGFEPVKNEKVLARIPKEARGKVLQANLKPLGIHDFGSLSPRGYGRPGQNAPLELFYRGRAMPLARWPNAGWVKIAGTEPGSADTTFTYDGDRPNRWSTADDIWLHGYWTEEWSDSFVQVRAIDTDRKTIVTAAPSGGAGFRASHRYYALNLLEELDTPGEWYLDRKTGILYFWPPETLHPGDVQVSLIDRIMVLKNTANITVRGITLESCRGTAVEVRGGHHNLVDGCVVRSTGTEGVLIEGGEHNGITRCEIYDTGEGGIKISGGVRLTLAPGDNYAENNRVHHFARWCRTYRPGIWLNGVGNRATHNEVHDAPHSGIMFSGNDHLIEYNEVYRIGLETDDVGAIYSFFQDWSQRGTVIRYNHLHDLKGEGKEGAVAVYLDDGASGTTVFGNILADVDTGVEIGGGRDNTVENNLFMNNRLDIEMDARGVRFSRTEFSALGNMRLRDKLREVNYDLPPYSTRYPTLPGILSDDPTLPKGNVLRNNAFLGDDRLKIDYISDALLKVEGTIEDNGLYFDRGMEEFPAPRDKRILSLGFTPIPVGKIGVEKDEEGSAGGKAAVLPR